MSKKTKMIRKETYWREKNYQAVIDRYEQLNKLRNIKEGLYSYDDIKDRLNAFDFNKVIDINKPLSKDEIDKFADKWSRTNVEIQQGLKPSQTRSLKQAVFIQQSAKDLGWDVSVQDIINNKVDYYDIRDAIRAQTNWTIAEIDFYIFGS